MNVMMNRRQAENTDAHERIVALYAAQAFRALDRGDTAEAARWQARMDGAQERTEARALAIQFEES